MYALILLFLWAPVWVVVVPVAAVLTLIGFVKSRRERNLTI